MVIDKKGKWIILIAFILNILFAFTCFATSSKPEQSVSPKADGTGGAGGTGGMGGSGTLTPDLFTGTMSYRIPIAVPAGRKGIQPDLALNYGSDNDNGYVGVGWDLEIPAIERSVRNGVSYTGDENGYVFRAGGSAIDLVHIGSNVYRAKIEGAFLKFVKTPNGDGTPHHWDVYDKAGVHYTYGLNKYGTDEPRQDDPDLLKPNRVFKWCLDRVEDPNGNYMTYSYFKDQNQIYVEEIKYTGNTSGFEATN